MTQNLCTKAPIIWMMMRIKRWDGHRRASWLVEVIKVCGWRLNMTGFFNFRPNLRSRLCFCGPTLQVKMSRLLRVPIKPRSIKGSGALLGHVSPQSATSISNSPVIELREPTYAASLHPRFCPVGSVNGQLLGRV